MRQWKYMAFLDPDDIIVPEEHYFVGRLISFIEKEHGLFSSFKMLQYLFPTWITESKYRYSYLLLFLKHMENDYNGTCYNGKVGKNGKFLS